MRRLIAVLLVAAGLLPVPAFAHPHIFVDAKAIITFNDAGQVVSIHNTWTFDEAYSAWSVQGLARLIHTDDGLCPMLAG